MAQRSCVTGGGGDPTGGRILRVLVAEDHPTNRRLAQTMLEPLGFDISFAENGQEAVYACQRTRFDIVLMDLQMPVMDGLTAIRHIRATEQSRQGGRRTPIVMVSANVGEEHEAAAAAAGADGHIGKPFGLDTLLRGIAAALQHARPGDRRRSG